MGACSFECVGFGKTAREAFRNAVEDAQWEYGHGGYSGTIAEKHDFVLYESPPRVTVEKLLGWASEYDYRGNAEYAHHDLKWAKESLAKAKPGTIRAAQKRVREAEANLKKAEKERTKFLREVGPHAELVAKISELYNDKWGPAVAFEVKSSAAKKRYLTWARRPVKRGTKTFLFAGLASS